MKTIDSGWNRLQVNDRLYHMPVPLVGLTGGIASGKSSVSRLLHDSGIKIIDADRLVKEIYQREDVIRDISKLAPTSVGDKGVDFKVLRQLFFSDSDLGARIEHIIYARIPQAFSNSYEQIKGTQNFIIYDVPLLFEKNLADKVDCKVCVWCEPEVQLERLMKRDGIDAHLAQQMLARQWPIDRKKQLSDLVVDNSGTLEQLQQQVENLLSQLLI